jgi:hypothetical protein
MPGGKPAGRAGKGRLVREVAGGIPIRKIKFK